MYFIIFLTPGKTIKNSENDPLIYHLYVIVVLRVVERNFWIMFSIQKSVPRKKNREININVRHKDSYLHLEFEIKLFP